MQTIQKEIKKCKKGIIVDIGTGDGKFVYELAKEHPSRFIIGIDLSKENVRELSAKIYKKPSRGGLKNALFVLASAFDLPSELNNIVNQVFINFPWGSLLKGVVSVDDKLWNGIKRVCKRGAFIDVLFGYDQSLDRTETERLNLPNLDLDYIQKTMIPRLISLGFSVSKAEIFDGKDVFDYPSTWAKKISFRQGRVYYYLRIKVERK
jgi:16S rRNA (adenine(1408)-N(1))-methyltransferase